MPKISLGVIDMNWWNFQHFRSGWRSEYWKSDWQIAHQTESHGRFQSPRHQVKSPLRFFFSQIVKKTKFWKVIPISALGHSLQSFQIRPSRPFSIAEMPRNGSTFDSIEEKWIYLPNQLRSSLLFDSLLLGIFIKSTVKLRNFRNSIDNNLKRIQ